MILFHGSIDRIEAPRIMPRELYRPLDFGTGFYTTSDYEQAARWVGIRLARNPEAQKGFVSTFEFDKQALEKSGGTIKLFNGVSVEWLRFIAENRLHGNVEHGYDVVVGPVANDRVYTVLNLYEGGFIDERNAIERMKPYRLADQYLFHTPLALAALKFKMSVEVSR